MLASNNNPQPIVEKVSLADWLKEIRHDAFYPRLHGAQFKVGVPANTQIGHGATGTWRFPSILAGLVNGKITTFADSTLGDVVTASMVSYGANFEKIFDPQLEELSIIGFYISPSTSCGLRAIRFDGWSLGLQTQGSQPAQYFASQSQGSLWNQNPISGELYTTAIADFHDLPPPGRLPFRNDLQFEWFVQTTTTGFEEPFVAIAFWITPRRNAP